MTFPITHHLNIPRSGFIHAQESDPRPQRLLQSLGDLRTHCLQNDIVDARYRLHHSSQEIPKLSVESLSKLQSILLSPIDVSEHTHINHDHLLLFLLGTLNPFACTFLLRGSKAAELIDPISLFCKWQGFSDTNIPKPSAHDIDWFCRMDQIPKDQMIPLIKEGIYRALPKETTRLHMTVPERSALVKTTPAIVLSTIGIEHKTDLAVGWLHTPYLFLRDAFAIHPDGAIDPSPYFWQAVTDHALGIVRLEHRHELDFYAFLAAMEHKTKGCLIIEEGTTLQSILRSFPSLSSYELDRAIKKRIRDHSVEPLAFFLNVLEQIAQERPLLAEEVWSNCLPFIKDQPQDRLHPFSQLILRDSDKMSFYEVHATLLTFSEAHGGFYPFAPAFPLENRATQSSLLKQLTIKALFTQIHDYHPAPLRPYPTQALLTLIDLFLDNKLPLREKKELQCFLKLKGDYELAPIELLQALLITPERLKPFSIHDPLMLFKKCPHSLQLNILHNPLWQNYFILRFTPEELISFFSSYSLKQKLELIKEPTYEKHLQALLLDFLMSPTHKPEKLKSYSQSGFLNILFKNLLLKPEKALEILSGSLFQELEHLKGFRRAFEIHAKDLLTMFATTQAFYPLLRAIQDHEIPIPKELSAIPLPKEHALALCSTAQNACIEIFLIQCFKNHALSAEDEERLFPILIKDLSLVNRLPVNPIRLTQIKLQIAHHLLQKEDREAEAIQIATEIQQSMNRVSLEQLYLFIDKLLNLLSTKPFPAKASSSDVLNLINVYFRVSNMPERERIAKRMQLSSHMQIRACGLLWHLRIIESRPPPYNPEELIGLFDGLASLSEPQRTLFGKDFSTCNLLAIQWDDERIVERIFDLFHRDFQSHLENGEPQNAFQSFAVFMNLQGFGFLKFSNVTQKLIQTIVNAAAQMFVEEDFRSFINLFYLTLSGFQLNGLSFPLERFDPNDLYLSLRDYMSQWHCEERDHLSMPFLSSLFVICKSLSKNNPRKSTFFMQMYYRFLKEYFFHQPTKVAQALFHQFLSWLILEEQFLTAAAADRYAGKLIVLGNQAGYFTPEELTLYELLTMKTPSTEGFSELSVINQIMVLASTAFIDSERKILRMLNILHFLIEKGSIPGKSIAASYLYSEIHGFVATSTNCHLVSFSQIFNKMKDAIGLLIQNQFKVPKETLIELTKLAAKCAKSPPKTS